MRVPGARLPGTLTPQTATSEVDYRCISYKERSDVKPVFLKKRDLGANPSDPREQRFFVG